MIEKEMTKEENDNLTEYLQGINNAICALMALPQDVFITTRPKSGVETLIEADEVNNGKVRIHQREDV